MEAPEAMVAPMSWPAGIKPTLTPHRKRTRPIYVYSRPVVMRMSWPRLKRRVMI